MRIQRECTTGDIPPIPLSPKQQELKAKHGTPEEFEESVWRCVPGCISITEALEAINSYNEEWEAAELCGTPS